MGNGHGGWEAAMSKNTAERNERIARIALAEIASAGVHVLSTEKRQSTGGGFSHNIMMSMRRIAANALERMDHRDPTTN
jgi:hypothetical protein